MKKRLLANWGIKLLSLLAAFTLWYTVVYFNDPPVEETFTNIQVQFTNTDVLTKENKVYEVLEGTDVIRRVTVKGPKTVLAGMTSDSIIAVADFKDMTMSNVIEIKLDVVSKYRSAVTEITASEGNGQLKLAVEDKKTKNVYVRTVLNGEVAQNYQVGNYKSEQNMITVSGAESRVDAVNYAAVTVDVSGISSDVSTIATILLYDENGNQIEGNQVQKSIGTTQVNVTVLKTKTIPVEFETSGEVAEGYRATGVIESSAQSIKIAGSEAVVNAIDRVTVPGEVLDLSERTESLTTTVNLKDILKNMGVQVAKDGGDGNITVTVYVEKEVEKTFKIPVTRISVTNIPQDLVLEELPEEELELTVAGLAADVSQIQENALRGTADVEAWMGSENISTLKQGTYEIPVQFELPEGIEVSGVVKIKVTLKKPEDIV